MRRDDAEDGPTLAAAGCTLATLPVVAVVLALLVRLGEMILDYAGRVRIGLQ